MTPSRKIGVGAILLGSVVAGGISLATLGSANAAAPSITAQSPSTTTDGSTANTTQPTNDAGANAGPHTADGVTEPS